MNKDVLYQRLLQSLQSLIQQNLYQTDLLQCFCDDFYRIMGKWWQGFYLVDIQKNTLVLGPFCGPPACEVIPFGKGVCGTAWKTRQTQVVADVHAFEGHIACSSASNSEIVVPVFLPDGSLVAVFDCDSTVFGDFDESDARQLEAIMKIMGDAWVG